MGVRVREKTKGSGELWIFINHNGVRKSKKVGRDRKKAMKVAKLIEAKLALGDFGFLDEAKQVQTFREYADTWITVTVPATCKESTHDDYGIILRKHILPRFGKIPIDQIKKSTVKTYLMGKFKSGLSKSTVGHLKSVLSGVLNLAVDDEAILVNPAQRLGKLFRKDEVRTEINPLTKTELTLFLKTAIETKPDIYPLFLLLARTGIRIGEAIALKWDDFDFDQRLITVRRNINKRGNADTPKAAKVRRVDMSMQLRDSLQNLYHQRKVEKLKMAGIGCLSGFLSTVLVTTLIKTIYETDYSTRSEMMLSSGIFGFMI